jgi:hypothetical protein
MRWRFGPTNDVGAAVVCPACGAAMSIGGGRFGSAHTIAINGAVSPSVVCYRCRWHTFIRLSGWPTASSGWIA